MRWGLFLISENYMKILFPRYIILLILMLMPALSHAQFYVTGDDPGKAKWYSIETDHFKVIYPEGADSLARVYAGKIEKYRIPVSLTTGYAAGDGDGRKMLLIACIHGVGLQIGHLLAAAKQRDAGVMDLAHQIAAVLADIKLCHSCILLISALCAGCLLY